MDGRQTLDDLLHELEDGQFGTKMRGYDPTEVDALLERAGRVLADLRASARRADERATLAERQLEEELEAARAARATAEAGLATAEAEAGRIVADARSAAADLKSATEAEVRVAIEAGRVRMEGEVAEAAGRRDRVLEEVDVTASHVAAHRARLLRSIADLQALVEDIDERPTGVEPAPEASTPTMPPAATPSPDTPSQELGALPPLPPRATEPAWPEPEWSEAGRSTPQHQASDVVTPIRPADPSRSAPDLVGDQSDLDAFFADDGS